MGFHKFPRVLDKYFCVDQGLGISQNYLLFCLISLHFCSKILLAKRGNFDQYLELLKAGQNIPDTIVFDLDSS